ncbi:MAG: hypothetical protein SR3Q1_10565 [Quinella sp. 3Q1]|nr:hypothetical protein [Quinella sp. 3Q1]MBR3049982.1 hypothetical protein [Selenomonadaceae bacterium]MBR6888302.1 hypothetical protein [Selenomonadaceae bacterium]
MECAPQAIRYGLTSAPLEGLAFFSPLKGTNKALQIAGRGMDENQANWKRGD